MPRLQVLMDNSTHCGLQVWCQSTFTQARNKHLMDRQRGDTLQVRDALANAIAALKYHMQRGVLLPAIECSAFVRSDTAATAERTSAYSVSRCRPGRAICPAGAQGTWSGSARKLPLGSARPSLFASCPPSLQLYPRHLSTPSNSCIHSANCDV